MIAASSTKTVTVCANKTTNMLRYAKNGTCASTETKVVLNQTGAKGATGARGAVGATGAKGDTGSAGSAGVAGAKGDTGSAGAVGAKGDTGSAGAVGAKGDTGSAGAVGAKGDTGAIGVTGATGPQGPGAFSSITSAEVPRLNPNIGGAAYTTTTTIYNGNGIELALSCYGSDSTTPKYSLFIKTTTEMKVWASLFENLVGVVYSNYFRDFSGPATFISLPRESLQTTNYTLSFFSSSDSKRVELEVESTYAGSCFVRGGFVQSS